jgi:hypothetical protein
MELVHNSLTWSRKTAKHTMRLPPESPTRSRNACKTSLRRRELLIPISTKPTALSAHRLGSRWVVNIAADVFAFWNNEQTPAGQPTTKSIVSICFQTTTRAHIDAKGPRFSPITISTGQACLSVCPNLQARSRCDGSLLRVCDCGRI